MTPRRWLLAALAALTLIWALTSFATVRSGESGVVLRFGRAARVVAPGVLVKLPWPIERVERVDVELLRRMPLGYRAEVAAQSLDPLPDEVQWLTGDSNIVELRADVLYRVDDPVAWLFGVSDGEGPTGHRSFALRRIGERVLSELIASKPVGDVLAPGNAGLQELARGRIQTACDTLGLGVRITAIEVLDATAPLMVIQAFNRVTDARAEAERLIVEARGARQRLLQDAETSANEVLSAARKYAAEHLGRAQGLAQRLQALAGGAGEGPDGAGAGGLSLTARRGIWLDTLSHIFARARVELRAANPDGSPVPYYRTRVR